MITASNINKNGFDEPSNWRNISFLVQSHDIKDTTSNTSESCNSRLNRQFSTYFKISPDLGHLFWTSMSERNESDMQRIWNWKMSIPNWLPRLFWPLTLWSSLWNRSSCYNILELLKSNVKNLICHVTERIPCIFRKIS